MKTNKIIAISILLVLLSLAMAVAQPSKRHFKRHRGAMMGIESFAEELGLSDEQISKIQEQIFERKKNAIDQRSKVQIAELELRKLMKAKTADETKIKNKIKEIGALKTELRLNRVEGRLAVRKELTAEQFERLQSLRKELGNKFFGRKGRQFRQQGGRKNFRGNRGGFGFGEFSPESFENNGEVTESESMI